MEVVIVLLVVSALLAACIPAYLEHAEQLRLVEVQRDMGVMELRIQRYYADRGEYPPDLDTIDMGGEEDPWGKPYQYRNVSTREGNGILREKQGGTPVNRDYDLYSMGPNGESQNQLLALASQDDIVRAEGGEFIGFSAEYCSQPGVRC